MRSKALLIVAACLLALSGCSTMSGPRPSRPAGEVLDIESAWVTPNAAVPGQSIESSAHILYVLPDLRAKVTITETHELVGSGDSFLLSRKEILREQGRFTSTLRFTLPKDIARGQYELVTTVTDGKLKKSVRTPLRIN